MRCDELRHLLKIYEAESDIVGDLIVAHIRSCQSCNHGMNFSRKYSLQTIHSPANSAVQGFPPIMKRRALITG